MEPQEYKYAFILSRFGLNRVKPLILKKVPVAQRAVIATGKLGTPVWDRFILQSDEENPKYKFTSDITLIEVNKKFKIKCTHLVNNKGSVKERIMTSDYDIKIRGVINSSDKDDYPREEIQTLNAMSELGVSLVAISDYLQLLGIYHIVINGIRFPQRAGRISQQAFEITALSDYAPELEFMPEVSSGHNFVYQL